MCLRLRHIPCPYVVHQWALDLQCLVVSNGPSELSLRNGESPCSRDKLRKVRQVDSLRGEMCCVRAPVVQKNGDDLEQLFAIALISRQERELDEFLPSSAPTLCASNAAKSVPTRVALERRCRRRACRYLARCFLTRAALLWTRSNHGLGMSASGWVACSEREGRSIVVPLEWGGAKANSE